MCQSLVGELSIKTNPAFEMFLSGKSFDSLLSAREESIKESKDNLNKMSTCRHHEAAVFALCQGLISKCVVMTCQGKDVLAVMP